MNTLTANKNTYIQRHWLILGSMVPAVGMLILFSTILPGVFGGYVWSFVLSAAFLGFAIVKKDKAFFKVIFFSYAAGIAELLPDHWLVAYTGTLFYPDQIKIYSSPLYMPFAWSVVLIQLGYIGWLFGRKFGKWTASFAMVALGIAIIPLYEHWAINAGWWHYENSPMFIGEIPYYIMLAEGLLMFTIPAFFDSAAEAGWKKIGLYGFLQGMVMWLACIIAWYTIGY